ncbi:hypothetical protein JCM30566_02670 [Marinitoga arctica]
MKNKLYKVLLENQVFSILIVLLIYIFSPYFNLWYSLLIAEIFTNSIGIIYFILEKLLSLFIKIEIKILNKVIHFLILIFSFFSGIVISEYIMSNLLAFNIIPSYKYLFLITLIVLLLLILSIIIIYKKLSEEIKKNERLKNEKLKAELSALRSKLNPHFLFNTLNTLLEIGQENPEQMEKIIINLSDIYRKILYSSDIDLIPLEEEINLIREYLEIEKIRLGDRLKCEFKIDNDLKHLKVPPLILEPIVENSIIHGISRKKDGGKVVISAIKKKGLVILEVSDNGIGKIEDIWFGFGLVSIKNRLDLMYDISELKFEQNSPSGIKATIIIGG